MGFDLTGLGSVADFAGTLVKRFLPEKMSDAEKAQAQLEMQQMLQAREDVVINAKRDIMVAEASQGDAYTKRARPSIVYAGLLFIGLVHVVMPMVAWVSLAWAGKPITDMPSLSLPPEFWWAWTGVVGVYSIGRSAEKRGVASSAISLITGNK